MALLKILGVLVEQQNSLIWLHDYSYQMNMITLSNYIY